ncbi:MAG: A/G-specific adenine glycosylase [Eubacteriales bacterium]
MKRDKVEEIPLLLLAWFAQNARVLPWRTTSTPYNVWVSEVMLQQTRVVAVIGYYERFLEELPTVSHLANCSEERLLKLWQGLGYYNRARNLQRGALQIMEHHDGIFPSTYEEIIGLSGIGEYTAGAISSIAFGLPRVAVDGNVLRVMARIYGEEGEITTPVVKRKITAQVEQMLPIAHAGDFNQSIMELGATVCLPNGAPLCEKCPVAIHCDAYLTDKTGEIPKKTPKKPRKVENRKVYLLFCEGRVALRKRPSKGLLAGLWEYPHYLEGEVPESMKNATKILVAKHIFTHIEWRMTGYTLETPTMSEEFCWVDKSQWVDYAIPNAFSAFEPWEWINSQHPEHQ